VLRGAAPCERVPRALADRADAGRVAADRDQAAVDLEAGRDEVGGFLQRVLELAVQHGDGEQVLHRDGAVVVRAAIGEPERVGQHRVRRDDVGADERLVRRVSHDEDDRHPRAIEVSGEARQHLRCAAIVAIDHDDARRRDVDAREQLADVADMDVRAPERAARPRDGRHDGRVVRDHHHVGPPTRAFRSGVRHVRLLS
jgi:hypothetical protein